MPVLARQQVDVVAFGPSPHDDASYYPIRAFSSLQDRQREEDALYGSDEWRHGGRGDREYDRAMTAVVIEMDEATVDGLRDGRRHGGLVQVEVGPA